MWSEGYAALELSEITSREDAIALLEGYAEERKDELDDQRTRRPLVKSYMLETVPELHAEPNLTQVFRALGHTLRPLDEAFSLIRDGHTGETVGVLERLLPRYPVIYSTEKSQLMDAWVNRLVRSSHQLDNLWLSGRAFEELLKNIMDSTPGHRFGRIVFQSTNLFDAPSGSPEKQREDDAEPQDECSDDFADPAVTEDRYIAERRSTTFSVVDRLEVLQDRLPKLRDIYTPLHAISQLRFPSRGRGGHDFYYHGKVTNRSDSFTEHRQLIRYVLSIYKHSTELTEKSAGLELGAGFAANDIGGAPSIGAPVLFEFSERLSDATFSRFVESTFGRKRNRFRLWGNPIRLGPTKVHVYALDRHLWQPIFMEITSSRMVVVVPRGTCGNTIHRLVTNVQQFLDPAVQVWVGDQEYASLIRAPSDPGEVYGNL